MKGAWMKEVWPNSMIPNFTCVKKGSIFFVSLLKRTRISSNILAL